MTDTSQILQKLPNDIGPFLMFHRQIEMFKKKMVCGLYNKTETTVFYNHEKNSV